MAAAATSGYLLMPALVVLAAGALLVLADRAMRQPGAAPILVYHSVSPAAGWIPSADNIRVRPETFRRHMQARGGWRVIATREFVEVRRTAPPLPRRSVFWHFGDGYLGNMQVAAQILREDGFPATFFVSADFIEPGDALRAAPDADGRPGAGHLTARRDPRALASRSTLALMSGNLYATLPDGFAALLRRRRFRRPGAHV